MRILFICVFVFGYFTISYSQKNELAEAFKNNDFDKVLVIAENILKSNPLDFDALWASGKVYNGKFQYQKAVSYLTKALQNANKEWQIAWCHTDLMESYFAIGDKEQSVGHFLKAKELNGTENSKKQLISLAKRFGFDEVYKNWVMKETNHIIFHFQDTSSIKNVDYYINERENAFLAINSFFNSKLPKKIDFFVWKNQKEAQKVLGHQTKLGFSNPMFCISHNRPNQSKGHEIAHNISFWLNKSVKRTKFINEGIGVWFDQENTNKIQKAKDVFKNNPFKLKDMWKNSRNYSDSVLYPVAGAFVKHLVSYDKDKFLKLCVDQSYENAEKIYGPELETLILNFNLQLNK